MNRKRILIFAIILALMLSPAPVFAADVSVTLDGKAVQYTQSSGSPFIDKNSRTQVPFRQTMETFGAAVSWDKVNRVAVATKDGITVKVPIGANYVYKNDVKIANDTAALILNGRTYLPIRVVLESFGFNVRWNSAARTVIVSTAMKGQACTVVRVIDGDTIIVDLNGTQERVRLIGIDTPELVGPGATKSSAYDAIASAASDFTKSRLEGQSVTLEMDVQDRDQYGRILAYVYIGGKMFNKTLLEKGYAQVSTYPPNVKYVDDFLALQNQARANKAGLWADKPFSGDAPAPSAPSVTTPASSVSAAEAAYTGNRNTKKFHRNNCRHVPTILPKNLIYFKTRADAISGGYVPCKVCKP